MHLPIMDAPAESAAPAAPAVSPLEAALAAFAATNPTEGKQIMDTIAGQQRSLEGKQTELEALQTSAVDKEILSTQVAELMGRLGSDITSRFHITPVTDHLMSNNPHVVANAANRVIAACNARFMSSAAPVEAPAPKRARVEEPAPAPVVPMEVTPPVTDDTSVMLRRALAAGYR